MNHKLFVFVIASFGDPIYIDLIKLRKIQFKKYNIPHLFIFDEQPPPNYTFDDNDIYLEKEVIVNYKAPVNPHMNPYMIQRFLKSLKLIDESQYDYIIRVNISTFINYNQLTQQIDSFPKKRFASAHLIYQTLPDWNIYNSKELILFSGLCIIISSDTITYLKTIDINSEILSSHNDDTVLSHLLHEYIDSYRPLHVTYLETNAICTDSQLINPIIRIKNMFDRRYDILHWINLLNYIDNINIDFTPQSLQ
jgi:hypothetical protein